ncbi:DUF4408 domain-containing protein [Massilia sp. CCM 8693]|uniref:DUF4408 domain-containing protein n=1 Tax=Massilia aquatica TaxID=2609000 RepID=A0ABX0MAD3_9BURK|nr:DUF4408 domain-containing protein [Massilia aquatica]
MIPAVILAKPSLLFLFGNFIIIAIQSFRENK